VIRRIARAPGVHASVVAFPTLLFVKIDDGTSGHRDWTSEKGVARRLTRGYISIILEP
jgi:hypothetical protein